MPDEAGSVQEFSLASAVLDGEVPFCVYTPPGYDPAGPPLPHVVFLHHWGGTHRTFFQMTEGGLQEDTVGWLDGMVKREELPPFLLFAPQACTTAMAEKDDELRAWEIHGQRRMFTEEFLPHIEAQWPLDRARRALWGLSYGGFGVSTYLAYQPQLARVGVLYAPAWGGRAAWFWNEGNAARLRAHSPALRIVAGEEDTTTPPATVERLHRRWEELGLAHEYHCLSGAGHDGRLFRKDGAAALQFVARAWEDAAG